MLIDWLILLFSVLLPLQLEIWCWLDYICCIMLFPSPVHQPSLTSRPHPTHTDIIPDSSSSSGKYNWKKLMPHLWLVPIIVILIPASLPIFFPSHFPSFPRPSPLPSEAPSARHSRSWLWQSRSWLCLWLQNWEQYFWQIIRKLRR